MKLATFGDDYRIGLVRDAEVVDATGVLGDLADLRPDERVLALIEQFDTWRSPLERLLQSAAGIPLTQVRLRPPIPRPRKVLCCLGNYKEFTQRERAPQDMFLQSPESICGPADTVVLPPPQATVYQHEAELVIVVGKQTKDAPPTAEGMKAILGYSCGIDVSGRGLSRIGQNSRMGKAFPGFKPMGPWIVTADEIRDPHALGIRLSVSGQLRQVYSTDDMEYRVAEVLSFASSYTSLLPGDVIFCGTNHQGLGPIQDGDRVEMEVDGIGELRINVADPLKRSWTREVDQVMAQRAREGFGVAPRT